MFSLKVRAKLNELHRVRWQVYTTTVDNRCDVWKSPVNISVNAVIAPSVNISHEEQETLNDDAISGKFINVIRSFPEHQFSVVER
jgi:phage tail sheath protein FI